MLNLTEPVDVAISYKSQRREAVKHLASVIEGFGFSVWWDDHLKPGFEYEPQIETAMAAAKAVIVLWCSLSVASTPVYDEALIAKHERTIIPVFLEDIGVDYLPKSQRKLETIKLYRWDGALDSEWLEKLVQDIESRTGKQRRSDLTLLRSLSNIWIDKGYRCLADFPLTLDPSAAQTPLTSRPVPPEALGFSDVGNDPDQVARAIKKKVARSVVQSAQVSGSGHQVIQIAGDLKKD